MKTAALLSLACVFFAASAAEGRQLRLLAHVDESQVVRPAVFQPPVFGTGSPGVGMASLTVDTETFEFVFDIEIDGIAPGSIDSSVGANVTGLHVHTADVNSRGPVVLDAHYFAREALPATDGIDGTPTGFRMHAEGVLSRVQGEFDTGMSPERMIELMRTELVFVAVHTVDNELSRTGAIRGNFQVVPDELRVTAHVDESQVVRPSQFQPPILGTGSPGEGDASLTLDTRTGGFDFTIQIDGIAPEIIDNSIGANGTGLHIHIAPPTARGPIALDAHYFAREAQPETNGLVTTENGFRLAASGTYSQVQGAVDTGFSLDQVVNAILRGNLFVAAHTNTSELFRTGAIRGNFTRVRDEIRMATSVDESQAVRPPQFRPPTLGTGSPGIGAATLVVDRDNGAFVFDIEIDGIAPEIVDNTIGTNGTGCHVHAASPDARGPVIIDVHHFAREASPETNGLISTANGFRIHAEGRLSRVQGAHDTELSVDEIIAALRPDNTFVAVHTTTSELFRTGAIRGNFSIVEHAIERFSRGDCDGDGQFRGVITDAVFHLGYLFLGIGSPPCFAACDVNADGEGNLADAIYALSFNFLGGPAPLAPFPACGSAHLPSDVELGCDASPVSCPVQ